MQTKAILTSNPVTGVPTVVGYAVIIDNVVIMENAILPIFSFFSSHGDFQKNLEIIGSIAACSLINYPILCERVDTNFGVSYAITFPSNRSVAWTPSIKQLLLFSSDKELEESISHLASL